jgi:hypothetical protein
MNVYIYTHAGGGVLHLQVPAQGSQPDLRAHQPKERQQDFLNVSVAGTKKKSLRSLLCTALYRKSSVALTFFFSLRVSVSGGSS